MRASYWFLILLAMPLVVTGQRKKQYTLSSPGKALTLQVSLAGSISWTAFYKNDTIVSRGTVSLKLSTNEVLGKNPVLLSEKRNQNQETITAVHYKKSVIENAYGEMVLSFKGGYTLAFRAYNDGFAYRWSTSRKDSLRILSEDASFSFPRNPKVYVPYVNDPRRGDIYMSSFENSYQYAPVSEIKRDTLSFLPVLVEGPGTLKIGITEADLEDYPGMFLRSDASGFTGVHAPFPLAEKKSERGNLQSFVTKRGDYIATTAGSRTFPWRVFIVAEQDKDLLNNDMVYRLASPSRVQDISWIKPGKVAWDWWNNWNISGVDFKAGINTETYKYFIDFAAAYHLRYVLLDEGWAKNNNMLEIAPAIDLPEIIRYAKSKNVNVWLWAAYAALNETMEEAMTRYADMGVVGFKVDFMDRDDQKMVRFYYRLAKKAAEHRLMLDLHGAYKPTGLQRTFPNILNFEGVRGLENVKWANENFPLYDCTAPFIRMLAGPMDYTPGAMRNASKANFRAVYASPMSQGTRCHQLALYVLYEAPLSMLADSPSNYRKERESAEFIASVPTVFEETLALAGEVSRYAIIARRSEHQWYLGAISSWESRTVTIPLNFLGAGNFEITIFQDGVNADRDATDYKKIIRTVTAADHLVISMASGGGWAATIKPLDKKN